MKKNFQTKDNILDEINNILDNFKIISDKIEWIKNNKDSILKLVLETKISELKFYKITSLLSAQSRSPLWEKYFKIKKGYDTFAKDENRGDLKKVINTMSIKSH